MKKAVKGLRAKINKYFHEVTSLCGVPAHIRKSLLAVVPKCGSGVALRST